MSKKITYSDNPISESYSLAMLKENFENITKV